MMNTINLIVNRFPSKAVFQSVSVKTIFSIQVNSLTEFENLDQKSFYSNEIEENEYCYFSFFINITDALLFTDQNKASAFKKKLLLYFFHLRYSKSNNKPVLFFSRLKNENAAWDNFINELNHFCINNGYDGVECISLDKSPFAEFSKSYCHTFSTSEKLGNDYFHLLKTEFYTASIYSIDGVPENQIQDAMQMLLASEEKLSEECKQQFLFMKKVKELIHELEDTETRFKNNQADLKNYKSYLEILKSQDEALKINDFYYYEYEILPLWYKKIGHLIKVFTGKRTFKSLFDNNVKKYKN